MPNSCANTPKVAPRRHLRNWLAAICPWSMARRFVAVSLTQRRRIDEAQMAANQLRKGRLGATLGVLAQEFGIFTHSSFTL